MGCSHGRASCLPRIGAERAIGAPGGREGGCWWVLVERRAAGEGRGSSVGLTSRVRGWLRNHMGPSVGWEEPSPWCSARRPGWAWPEAGCPGTGREGGQRHPAWLNAGPAAAGRPG